MTTPTADPTPLETLQVTFYTALADELELLGLDVERAGFTIAKIAGLEVHVEIMKRLPRHAVLLLCVNVAGEPVLTTSQPKTGFDAKATAAELAPIITRLAGERIVARVDDHVWCLATTYILEESLAPADVVAALDARGVTASRVIDARRVQTTASLEVVNEIGRRVHEKNRRRAL